MLFKRTPAPRKVFGFLCSPQLSNLMKDLSVLMTCPIFTVCEHALEIGALSIVSACEDEESKTTLTKHLQTEHLLKTTLTLHNEYDIATAQQALRQELGRMRLDKSARELISKAENEGIPAQLLIDIAEGLIDKVKQRSSQTNYTQRRQQ